MGKRGQDHSNSMVVTRKRERKATACMDHKAIVSDSRVFLFYLGFIRTPQEVASPSASPAWETGTLLESAHRCNGREGDG